MYQLLIPSPLPTPISHLTFAEVIKVSTWGCSQKSSLRTGELASTQREVTAHGLRPGGVGGTGDLEGQLAQELSHRSHCILIAPICFA